MMRSTDQRRFAAEYDQVFQATAESLREAGFALRFLDRQKGIIQTEEKVVEKDATEGESRNFDSISEYARVTVYLSEEGESSASATLMVDLREIGTKHNGSANIIKRSDGRWEESLYVRITDKLNDRPRPPLS